MEVTDAALGVWLDGRYQVIYFEMVEKETKVSWKKFFRGLLDKGLDKSLIQLVVSDGRPGLHTAIRSVFLKTVKHQRCIFHKLKNLGDNLTYKNLKMDPNLSRRESRKQAKKARACGPSYTMPRTFTAAGTRRPSGNA
ncbi:MAG: hypothetical protein GY832_28125 [Chloroflexi bacterium]|nr:hypothetical protein [Chloroflexota bacterium]